MVLGRRMTRGVSEDRRNRTSRSSRESSSRERRRRKSSSIGAAPAPTRWLHHQIVPLGDGVAVTSRDVTDRKHAEEELRALTLVDDLTGLYNRRGFRMLAEQHLRLVKRGGPVSLLVCFDLDGFKRVNDLFGHAEGDAALRRTASILRTAFRDSDIIARFGGDEFVVLALDCGEIREQLLVASTRRSTRTTKRRLVPTRSRCRSGLLDSIRSRRFRSTRSMAEADA